MRAKSDLTDQSECGLPYSVFGELAVKLVFTEATDQAQLVMLWLLWYSLTWFSVWNRWSVVWYDASLTQGSFYCSENSLQCYNESAEPTAERIVRIRSIQPGARDRLTRATHRAQHPVLRAGAGVSSPSTLFYPPTIPLQQYLLKATINRGHGTRFVFVCVLSLRETRVDECTVMLVLFMTH